MAIRQDSSTAIVAGLAGAAAGVAIACGLRGPTSSGKQIVAPSRQPLDEKYSKALEDARKEFGEGKWEPQDGATASAWVAYQCVDNVMIFPITPSTLMAEMADTWATSKVTNAFDQVPVVNQLQSEAGAAGAVHGCLAVGGLATTFTASQGLLLMLPNMLKIAGELTPCVFHVPARAVAGQALSIFGDQNDLCQVRSTGFSILFGSTVQETLDFALAAHIATLRSRVPFVNSHDGFRTSHELQKIQVFPKAVYKRVMQLLQPEIDAHRARGLNPNHPHVRGTAQCEDIYFQAVEKSNQYYLKVPAYVEEAFQCVEKLCGRKYDLFEYVGSKRAKYVVVIMGSGSGAVEEYLDHTKNSDFGMVKVRLFRPWSLQHFLAALPLGTLKGIAVCNKMKEAAAMGEPLFMDVCASLQQAGCTAAVLNGRFGLSSKDLTPGMVEAIFDNLKAPQPKHPFTIGIEDDITFYSLPYKCISTVPDGTTQCIFWGFGSDGTVGANKNTIKIIAQNTPLYAQGYFQYDALKSGGVTISYLRFGPQPIKASYLIDSGCGYLAMHKKEYIFSMKAHLILGPCKDESTLVLNVPWTDKELDAKLPAPFKKMIGQKRLKVYAIDANAVAKLSGMGRLINNIMTAVFFQLSLVLPVEQAVGLLKDAVKKTYKSKGDAVVGRNITAVDAALSGLRTVNYDAGAWSSLPDDDSCYKKVRATEAPAYVTDVLDKIQFREGGELKVSQL
jgi:pyruvate-ferredoxin/flavodoxin oxidoreductase